MVPKFRAWHMPFGPKELMQEMVYGKASSILAFAEMSPDKYIVEQYTGLKDANGRKIFEGDIITAQATNDDDSTDGMFGKINYDADIASFGFTVIGGDNWDNYSFDNLFEEGFVDLHVIGNVHENPELLEEKK